MKQTILVVCRSESSARFVATLNSCPGVIAWSQVWPGAIVIKITPEATIKTVEEFLTSQLPMEMYLLTQMSVNFWTIGRMDPKMWDFILNG